LISNNEKDGIESNDITYFNKKRAVKTALLKQPSIKN
jgi:hypothetical protein